MWVFSKFRYNKSVIIKDKDSIANASKNEAKGEAAEKQMAFYLNRQFGDSKDVFVFNDLRVERNSEVAQMDHLEILVPIQLFGHQQKMLIVQVQTVLELED